MTGSVEVNPDGLAALGRQLAALAEQVRASGHALTAVGRPVLGGTDPSYDLANELSTNASSSATWVMTCGSALRALAQAATEAAEAYRTTEAQAAQRFAAMTAAFDEFDDMYGLLADTT
jgi:hypothetical protein